MKKQAFVLTLGVVLLSVVAGLGMLINAQGPMSSSGGGRGRGVRKRIRKWRRGGNNHTGGELPTFGTLHTQQPDDLSRSRQECFRGKDFYHPAGSDDAEEGCGL